MADAKRLKNSAKEDDDESELEKLPLSMLSEIIARVAEDSLEGLASVKQCRRKLKEVAEEKEVYRRSDLKPVQIEAIWDEMTKLNRGQWIHLMICQAFKTPFIAYVAAAKAFFQKSDLEGALRHLEKAVGSRSVYGPATYLKMLGLIFSGKDEKIEEGVWFWNEKKAEGFFEKELDRCRDQIQYFLRDHNWRQLPLTWIGPDRVSICPLRMPHRMRRIENPWNPIERIDECAACDADREAEFVTILLF